MKVTPGADPARTPFPRITVGVPELRSTGMEKTMDQRLAHIALVVLPSHGPRSGLLGSNQLH